jgi:uncharacterized protein YvpB
MPTSLRRLAAAVAISGLLTLLTQAVLPVQPVQAAATASTSGRLDVFVRGTDNQLYQRTFNGSAWGNWLPLGGQLAAEPAAVESADGSIDVFVRGTDNGLYRKTWTPAGWSGWQVVGGTMLSAPAAASASAGHFDVFYVGADLAAWHRTWDGNAWSQPQSLGGRLTSNPAAISPSAGTLEVYGRGTDNALWHRSFTGNWNGWQSLGGSFISGPGATSWGSGREDVYAVGTNGELFSRSFTGSNWTLWGSLGGQLTSDPFAASVGPGRIDVFARATDNALWHLPYANRWGSWSSVGGVVVAGQDAITLPVPVYKQTMTLDCETAALQMVLSYAGHYYTQQDLFSLENPDTRAPVVSGGLIQRWGDPYTNFVGNVNGTDHYPPTGYGIYYPPILSIAESHGTPNATGAEGLSTSSIYTPLAAGHPIEAWVEVGWYRPAVHFWTAWDGRSIRYTLDEHTVVLTGLSMSGVRVNDPWHGTQYWVSRGTFEASWADFNDMAVIFQ